MSHCTDTPDSGALGLVFVEDAGNRRFEQHGGRRSEAPHDGQEGNPIDGRLPAVRGRFQLQLLLLPALTPTLVVSPVIETMRNEEN